MYWEDKMLGDEDDNMISIEDEYVFLLSDEDYENLEFIRTQHAGLRDKDNDEIIHLLIKNFARKCL